MWRCTPRTFSCIGWLGLSIPLCCARDELIGAGWLDKGLFGHLGFQYLLKYQREIFWSSLLMLMALSRFCIIASMLAVYRLSISCLSTVLQFVSLRARGSAAQVYRWAYDSGWSDLHTQLSEGWFAHCF